MNTGVHARAERDVSFRDVTIETPDRKYNRGMWMTSCTGSVRGGFGDLEKSQLSWVPVSEEDGWLSGLTEALRQVSHVVWSRLKSQLRKIVPLSPYVEKPFNSKVIKSFVPELRSRKCFFLYFGITMLSIYGHYERFAYRYEFVYFTYSYLAM